MALGDRILISPDLTMQKAWIEGRIIELDDNSFIGTVISAETPDGNVFFGKPELFKAIA